MKKLGRSGIALTWAILAVLLAVALPCKADPSPSMELVAKFTYTASGSVVEFTDASQGAGITTWLWDFGDGHTSTTQNPTHRFASVGNYTVTMTITDSQGHKTTTYAIIEVSSITPNEPISGVALWVMILLLLFLAILGFARSRNPLILTVCAIMLAVVFAFLFGIL